MKHPPLLPSLFGVMLLGLAHLEMQSGGGQLGDLPFADLTAIAAVLIGGGAVFAPLLKKDPGESQGTRDDDFDLSA